jgi:hypothetical protein
VFAQELHSLFLNKTLELYLNTMFSIVFEFNILNIIYYQTKAIKKTFIFIKNKFNNE